MELLRLKKRTQLAQKGHKLLKEKRDGLMREFLKIVREAHDLRQEIDRELTQALQHFILAQSVMTPQAVRMISYIQSQRPHLTVGEKNVMGVKIPVFDISIAKSGEDYGVWETSPELDIAMMSFQAALPKLLQLAAIEKSAELLAQEIEKTRRRVNALEHVLIPQLKQTVKYIRMKLEERERAAIVTTMTVKRGYTES
jgi:V/A-type H+/Na+-transporting ATPase subunit D